MEELQAKHRKEQRDLQARITQKKKNATKKTRKGVNEECDRLQQELNERHKLEVSELNGELAATVTESLDNLDLDDEEEATAATVVDTTTKTGDATEKIGTPIPEPTTTDNNTRGKKPNRQKARLARREAERVAQAEIAAEEAAKQTDHRGNEKETMEASFKRLGLQEVEINPDGHCLYSAIAHQLDTLGLGLKPDPERIVLQSSTLSRVDTVTSPKHDGYRAVRAVAADYIIEHQDDFTPFMEDPLDEYVRKIRLTAEWGGQLELQAIARAYGVEINVLQGDGRVEKIEPGSETDDEVKKIWLAYYRHTYGLGEHYNALARKTRLCRTVKDLNRVLTFVYFLCALRLASWYRDSKNMKDLLQFAISIVTNFLSRIGQVSNLYGRQAHICGWSDSAKLQAAGHPLMKNQIPS